MEFVLNIFIGFCEDDKEMTQFKHEYREKLKYLQDYIACNLHVKEKKEKQIEKEKDKELHPHETV